MQFGMVSNPLTQFREYVRDSKGQFAPVYSTGRLTPATDPEVEGAYDGAHAGGVGGTTVLQVGGGEEPSRTFEITSNTGVNEGPEAKFERSSEDGMRAPSVTVAGEGGVQLGTVFENDGGFTVVDALGNAKVNGMTGSDWHDDFSGAMLTLVG